MSNITDILASEKAEHSARLKFLFDLERVQQAAATYGYSIQVTCLNDNPKAGRKTVRNTDFTGDAMKFENAPKAVEWAINHVGRMFTIKDIKTVIGEVAPGYAEATNHSSYWQALSKLVKSGSIKIHKQGSMSYGDQTVYVKVNASNVLTISEDRRAIS